MNLRRFLIEGATLVIAAIVLGLVANAIASSERRVTLAASAEPARRAEDAQATDAPPSAIIEDDGMASTTGGETPAPGGGPPVLKASRETLLQRFPSSPEIPAEEIHTADAKWLWEQGVMFLDARRTSIYNEGHIPGARPFAIWEADVDDKVKELATEGLDPDMPIVIYCSGGECEDSHLLAQKLWGMFFNNLLVYHEGFPGWNEAGHPVERGPRR